MMNLRWWLSQQVLSVRELARQIDVPVKTVQDWVYRGTEPCPMNMETLLGFVQCTHYWVIARSNGPLSEGVCQLCGEKREFMNSEGLKSYWSKSDSFARRNGAAVQKGRSEKSARLIT